MSTRCPPAWAAFVDTLVDFACCGFITKAPDSRILQSPSPPTTLPAVPRLVAIGDLHGDLAKARAALSLAGLIDERDCWTGGATTLVQVGDILDRGPDEVQLFYLLERLQHQAAAAGGAVHVLNGNHETMSAGGRFNYADPRAYPSFEHWMRWQGIGDALKGLCAEGGLPRALQGALRGKPWGPFGAQSPSPAATEPLPEGIPEAGRARFNAIRPGGAFARRFLAPHPTVLQVGSSVFVHGGLLPSHVAEPGLERINEEVSRWLRGPDVLSTATPQVEDSTAKLGKASLRSESGRENTPNTSRLEGNSGKGTLGSDLRGAGTGGESDPGRAGPAHDSASGVENRNTAAAFHVGGANDSVDITSGSASHHGSTYSTDARDNGANASITVGNPLRQDSVGMAGSMALATRGGGRDPDVDGGERTMTTVAGGAVHCNVTGVSSNVTSAVITTVAVPNSAVASSNGGSALPGGGVASSSTSRNNGTSNGSTSGKNKGGNAAPNNPVATTNGGNAAPHSVAASSNGSTGASSNNGGNAALAQAEAIAAQQAAAHAAWRRRHGPEYLHGRNAVVWLRRFSHTDAAKCDCGTLEAVLERIPGAQRMVVGHTIQYHQGVNSACGGRVIRVDVGLSALCGDRPPQVLEIINDRSLRVLGEDGSKEVPSADPPPIPGSDSRAGG
eukprot:jgi/Mesvir1/7700/Mv11661-RA.1